MVSIALVAACGAEPSPSSPQQSIEARSAAPTPRSTPTTDPAPTPLPTPDSPPTASPTPTALAIGKPPYPVLSGGPPQEPGTIIFGDRYKNEGVAPFTGWPDAGLSIDRTYAFGAFWGEPAKVPRIRVTLYRVFDDTLELVWTDEKSIARDATGFSDTLVRFKRTGLYRLEVTRGPEVLAWALTRMYPPCAGACSGG